MDIYAIVQSVRQRFGTGSGEAPVATLARGLIDSQGNVVHLDDQRSGIAGVIVHDGVASTPRPVGFHAVTWIGSVEPTNMAENDIWEEV